MNFVSVFFGVLFSVSGVLFSMGKILPRLSVWKHMPEADRKKVRIVPLCRNIGEIITLSGILFLINGLWEGFRDHWFAASMAAWLIVAGLDVWYITKSSRYKN